MYTCNSSSNKTISAKLVLMTPAVQGKIAMEVSKLLHAILVVKVLHEGVILLVMVRIPEDRPRFIADIIL